MKIWHISLIVSFVVWLLMFITASISPGISALLFMVGWPGSLIWLGWNMKTRSISRQQDTERRVLNKLAESKNV